ncbi:MAG TPA: hypothetical protein VIT91_00210 [Chthoniobacterales bacterium]
MMHIDYTVQIWKEGRQFVAHAMPLDVASSESTVEAVREALDEAVRLFVATCAEMGTLDEVLEEAGYERDRNEWQSPEWFGLERRELALGV